MTRPNCRSTQVGQQLQGGPVRPVQVVHNDQHGSRSGEPVNRAQRRRTTGTARRRDPLSPGREIVSTDRQVGDHPGEFGELRGADLGRTSDPDSLLRPAPCTRRTVDRGSPVQGRSARAGRSFTSRTVRANSRSSRLLPMPGSRNQRPLQTARRRPRPRPRPGPAVRRRDRRVRLALDVQRLRGAAPGGGLETAPGHQSRILGQHHRFQLAQRWAGFNPQFVASPFRSVWYVCSASACRPHRYIRCYPLRPQPFPERIGRGTAPQFAEHLGVPAARQIRLDPGLQDSQPDLGEPVRLGLQVAGAGLGQSLPTPQRQRLEPASLTPRRIARRSIPGGPVGTVPRMWRHRPRRHSVGIRANSLLIEAVGTGRPTTPCERGKPTPAVMFRPTRGGSPSHNASISRSDGTTRPDCRASRTSSPRSLPPESPLGGRRTALPAGPVRGPRPP